MKQGILLMAIYALILNQVNKNEQSLTPKDEKVKSIISEKFASSAKYHINTYKYFDQDVYLVTFRESNRKMMVMEDGLTYEVFDSMGPVPSGQNTSTQMGASFAGIRWEVSRGD